MAQQAVRVRFAPSPTGYLHIGGARTALFNWLLARQTGGVFVLRIEDTDRARHVEGSIEKILDDLNWMGLHHDEGPEVGGDFGPYFQSERLDIYKQHVQKLLDAGRAYYAFETKEELDALREQARTEKRDFRYVRPDPLPTEADAERARRESKPVVIRFAMPNTDIVVKDEILGQVKLSADDLEDFIIVKADGWPTYHFACVVDDALMNITHVLRGQEHLINTPRHIALQQALGFDTPTYAHLPIIFNPDGSKMSKRDKEKALAKGLPPPEIDVHDFRAAGYLPECLLNFIALLGWSPGGDREKLSMDELIDLFSVSRIGKTNARFDRDKLLAFNTEAIENGDEERLTAVLKDYLDVSRSPIGFADDGELRHLLKACHGIRTFRDLDNKSRFIFLKMEEIAFDEKAVTKVLKKGDNAGLRVLADVHGRLAVHEDWSPDGLETLLKSICQEKDLGLGKVAQPIRVAVSGTTISPPIFDTLALLGKEATLRRIKRTLETFPV